MLLKMIYGVSRHYFKFVVNVLKIFIDGQTRKIEITSCKTSNSILPCSLYRSRYSIFQQNKYPSKYSVMMKSSEMNSQFINIRCVCVFKTILLNFYVINGTNLVATDFFTHGSFHLDEQLWLVVSCVHAVNTNRPNDTVHGKQHHASWFSLFLFHFGIKSEGTLRRREKKPNRMKWKNSILNGISVAT